MELHHVICSIGCGSLANSAVSVDTTPSDITHSLSEEDLMAGSFDEVSSCTDATLLTEFLWLYWL